MQVHAADARISKESVDTFLSTSAKRFSDSILEPRRFSRRLWISTTDSWTANAEASLQNQVPPVMKIGLAELAASPVDWAAVEARAHGGKGTLRPHFKSDPVKDEIQAEAIAAAHGHFKSHDRGKLIMACGTGKTYTSLRIAENEVKPTGLVLFLVPSIALLGQTLDEWTAHAARPLRPMCVCSDADVSQKRRATDDGGFTVEDLAFPAVTNVDEIVRQFRALDLMAKTNGASASSSRPTSRFRRSLPPSARSTRLRPIRRTSTSLSATRPTARPARRRKARRSRRSSLSTRIQASSPGSAST